MEAYRSGHNGPDSKSGSPHGLEGSNPSASAKRFEMIGFKPFFVILNHVIPDIKKHLNFFEVLDIFIILM